MRSTSSADLSQPIPLKLQHLGHNEAYVAILRGASLDRKEWQAYEQCNAEFRKQERYCQEQREVLRAL